MAHIALSRYQLNTEKIISPVRLLIIADLHSTPYGEKQEALLSMAEAEKPDAVLFPGDIIDDRRDEAPAFRVLAALGGCVPCYYVSGNHEFRTGKLPALKERISACGVRVLAGNAEMQTINGNKLLFAGVDDPSLWGGYRTWGAYPLPAAWEKELAGCKEAASAQKEVFSLLLSHRPELAEVYSRSAFDLVAAGHAHGGQLRFGPINGIFAPCQGLFPRYAGGLYDLGETKLIVSRGLMRNRLPRLGNPPELVSVSLLPKK